MNIQYVTTADNEITGVLIPIKDWQNIESMLPNQVLNAESQEFWWKTLKQNWKRILTKIITKEEGTKSLNKVDIQKIFELKNLSCNDQNLSDLAPLKRLTNLTRLHCEHNQITDLSPLSGVISLKTLHCDHNQISSLEGLETLEHLSWLYCHNNQISDLIPLANLKNLKVLHCEHNQITDLSAISRLSNLKNLYCHNNPIQKLQIEKFQEQHPNCKVVY